MRHFKLDLYNSENNRINLINYMIYQAVVRATCEQSMCQGDFYAQPHLEGHHEYNFEPLSGLANIAILNDKPKRPKFKA